MDKKIALVLEGGGFRGIYSAGILDFFLEKQIEFPYIVGVSMGACNAVNYISQQIGRNLKVPYTYINDERYISFKRLFSKGELFGMDFIFNEIPTKLDPFDFDKFYNSDKRLVVTTTDCESGKSYFIDDFNSHCLMESLKATTSLPYASKIVSMNNLKLLDGGISDSIPYKKAFDEGFEKLVVILTQPKGFVKEKMKLQTLGKVMYRKYPKLREAIKNRHIIYNKSVEELEKLEKEGKVFLIRPESKIPISRTERDKEKLKEAFELGYRQAENFIEELELFMKK